MNKNALIVCAVLIFNGCTTDIPEGSEEIRQVNYTYVSITDDFFLPRMIMNDTLIIPQNFAMSEATGRIGNFVRAAKREGTYSGKRYDDSDVYKIIEGAAYSLHLFPDDTLEAYVDSIIGLIAGAQEEDGYLYTVRTMKPGHPPERIGDARWELELNGSHEIYNMGHMFEAAAAWYRTTGKTNLLDVAVKSADLMVATFGYDKLHMAPGHQGVEMGLIKLYDITGKKEYLELAGFFIEMRGRVDYPYDPDKPWEVPVNRQTHMPFTEQREAVGHAVRAVYMYAGAADLVRKGGFPEYLDNLTAIWNDVLNGKIYITGGIGNDRAMAEAFGAPCYLPNLEAYCETCAAIASVFWNHRMFLLTGESKFYDVVEVTLYNGLLSGLSLDEATFFYPNPLEFDGTYRFNADNSMVRMPWFSCSCCPTNISRFLPQLGKYFYAQKEDTLYMNLYASNHASFQLPDGALELYTHTGYPWEGKVAVEVTSADPVDAALALRIPGWLNKRFLPGRLYNYVIEGGAGCTISINGQSIDQVKIENGYCLIDRTWENGDRLELNLPMDTRINWAHDCVKEDRGKVAITRGPLVYCMEETDNPSIETIEMPLEPSFTVEFEADLLHGVNMISEQKSGAVLVPYYAWANREFGRMKVWIPSDL